MSIILYLYKGLLMPVLSDGHLPSSPKIISLILAESLFQSVLLKFHVGGKKLPIPISVFSSAGAIIDSGTVITRLPPAAYSILRSTFKKFMSKYPTAPASSILDTSLKQICLAFAGNSDDSDIAIFGNVQQEDAEGCVRCCLTS
ncbi:hypothetical protein WN943_000179 [Citrus x changshan-huyou]